MRTPHIIASQGNFCSYSELLEVMLRLRRQGKKIITAALPDTLLLTKADVLLRSLREKGDLLIAISICNALPLKLPFNYSLLNAVDYLLLVEDDTDEALLQQLSSHQHFTISDDYEIASSRSFSSTCCTYDHEAFASFLKGAELFTEFALAIFPLATIAAARISAAIAAGHKVLICGNGGSAADAQHFAAEIVGRYLCERNGWPAIALTVDSSIITSLANDYGFATIFSRQVQAMGQAGDILLAISTSGHSANILAAAETAREKGIFTIGLTGEGETPLSALCDITLSVPSSYTPHIQQAHIAVIHLLCELIEKQLTAKVLDNDEQN